MAPRAMAVAHRKAMLAANMTFRTAVPCWSRLTTGILHLQTCNGFAAATWDAPLGNWSVWTLELWLVFCCTVDRSPSESVAWCLLGHQIIRCGLHSRGRLLQRGMQLYGNREQGPSPISHSNGTEQQCGICGSICTLWVRQSSLVYRWHHVI